MYSVNINEEDYLILIELSVDHSAISCAEYEMRCAEAIIIIIITIPRLRHCLAVQLVGQQQHVPALHPPALHPSDALPPGTAGTTC